MRRHNDRSVKCWMRIVPSSQATVFSPALSDGPQSHFLMACWTPVMKKAVEIREIIRPLAACSGATSRRLPCSATLP